MQRSALRTAFRLGWSESDGNLKWISVVPELQSIFHISLARHLRGHSQIEFHSRMDSRNHRVDHRLRQWAGISWRSTRCAATTNMRSDELISHSTTCTGALSNWNLYVLIVGKANVKTHLRSYKPKMCFCSYRSYTWTAHTTFCQVGRSEVNFTYAYWMYCGVQTSSHISVCVTFSG